MTSPISSNPFSDLPPLERGPAADRPLFRLISTYASGRPRKAILQNIGSCCVRNYIPSNNFSRQLSLRQYIPLPAGTEVLLTDQENPDIIGYRLTEDAVIDEIPCAKNSWVEFDEEGYLIVATLARQIWLPGHPWCEAGEEYRIYRGKPIPKQIDPAKIEKTFLGFFRDSFPS